MVESFEVQDRVDYPRARPGADGVVWVLAFEPSRQCAWVAPPYCDPVGFTADGI